MFGQFQNWLSNTIPVQLPGFNNNNKKEDQEQPQSAAEDKTKHQNEGEVVEKVENSAEATAVVEDAEKKAPEPQQQEQKSEKILNIDKDKALEAAKEIGSLFLSFGKNATNKIQETATHLKDVLEKNTIIGDFSKENEKFVNEKKTQQRREDAAVAPWVGYTEEEKLKEQILSLSTDSRNFLRNPPAGVEFHFDFTQSYPIALATLEEDPSLKEMRFNLVPKKITEELFWRNYFYRVSLIKQSTQLNQLVNEQELFENKSSSSSSNSIEKSGKSDSKTETLLDVTPSDAGTIHNEFVSDSYETSINEEEIKRDMKQLKLDSNNKNNTEDLDDQDWDKELQEDDIDNITAEELEKEISQMIGNDTVTSK